MLLHPVDPRLPRDPELLGGLGLAVAARLEHRCIELYEQPRSDGDYQQIVARRAGETVGPRLPDGERFEILADRILP